MKRITNNTKCNIIINDNFDENYVYVYTLHFKDYDDQVIIKTKESDQVLFNTSFDGIYDIMTIKVPIDPVSNNYYYLNGKFYNGEQEITIMDLLDSKELDIKVEKYFNKCKLRQCYIDICYKIFNQSSNNCGKGIDSNLLYIRDLIWMSLNVIDYMVEMEQYDEAERLLDRVTGCNGLCKSSNCGCHE